MKHYPDRPAREKFPETAGSLHGCRGSRVFSRVVLVVTGLVLLGMAGMLDAADTKATNAAAGNLAVSLSAKSSVAAATNAFNVLDDQYQLVIGDQLSFRILEDTYVEGNDAPLALAVTDSGDVQLPYIGRYPAVGKTCKQLALALKTELEKDYYKTATVVVAVDAKPRSRGKIYLTGAISAPGPQDIPSDETLTLSKAILRAGGLNRFSNGNAVQITRGTGPAPGDETRIIVDVAKILSKKGNTHDDVVLQPGDLIFVPDRLFQF